MKYLLSFLLSLLIGYGVAQTPVAYYQFENSLSGTPGAILTTSGTYSYVNGYVGKAISLNGSSDLLNGPTLNTTDCAIEFLYKPGYGNQKKYVSQPINYITTFFNIGSNRFDLNYPPAINLESNVAVVKMGQSLGGLNQQSFEYWLDSSWKYVVVNYSSSSSTASIYINGQLVKSGTCTSIPNGTFSLNSSDSRLKFYGYIDEVALYGATLTPTQIGKHYTDFKAGSHYSAGSAPLPAQTVTSALNDIRYLPSGYTIGAGNQNSITQSFATQLKASQLPRYNYNNTWYGRNSAAWFNLQNMSGYNTDSSLVIQRELAFNWYYSITVANDISQLGTQAGTTGSWAAAWSPLANSYPSITADYTASYPHLANSVMGNQNYPAATYVRTNTGAARLFGTAVKSKAIDVYTPSTYTDSLKKDGAAIATRIRNLYKPLLTRPINRFFENNEWACVLGHEDTAITLLIPSIVTAKNTSGLYWYDFFGTGWKKYHQDYTDSIKAVLPGVEYSIYYLDGNRQFSPSWRIAKSLHSTVFSTQKMSCPDSYMIGDGVNVYSWTLRNSYNTHGLYWFNNTRQYEILQGDSLFTPYISAGWSDDPEKNMNSGTWLGFLKVLGSMGVNYYLPAGFGSTNATKSLAYQLPITSYAHAVFSRLPNYRNSYNVLGDVQDEGFFMYDAYIPTWATKSLLFYTGNNNTVATVRKDNNRNMYYITTALFGNNNQIGNPTDQFISRIVIGSDSLDFYSRPQGSVYVWEKDSSVFYQVDGWHERWHPTKWNTDVAIEAELADNYTHKITTGNTGKNFTNYETTVYFNSGDTASYTFQPRPVQNYYLHIKASGIDGTITVKTKSVTYTIGCVNDDTWYSAQSCSSAKLKILASDTGTIKITASTDVAIDKLFFAKDSTFIYNASPNCSGVSPTIISLGVFGNTETIGTSTTYSSYAWSNGQVTQNISVASGTYTVTVSDGLCTGTASRTVTIFNANPCLGIAYNLTYTNNKCWTPVTWEADYDPQYWIIEVTCNCGRTYTLQRKGSARKVVLSGLVPVNTYTVRIRGKCSTAYSNWSAPISFINCGCN